MKNYLLALFFMVATFLGGVASNDARAEMLITPIQIVFEGRDRFSFVTLVNTSDKTYSYDISFVHMKMVEGDGTYSKMENSITDFDLSKYIVFSPKKVKLAPGAKQRVRFALRRPESVPDGDYHVHLMFKSVRQDDNSNIEKRIAKNAAKASVNFNISYSIPVVLRSGDVVVNASVGDLSLSRSEDTGRLTAEVTVNRDTSTPYSVLGYLRVYNVSDDGNEILVGEVSNANIFSEISSRVFNVPFTKDVKGGALRVVLSHYDSDRNIMYAERSFPIQ